MQSAKRECIILSRRDFGEGDRLIQIYSLENGRQTVLAKGVRKTLSRLGGFLEQFTHVEMVLNGNYGLPIVNDSHTLDSLKNLRTDFELIAKANQLAQVVQKLTAEGESNPQLFKLLLESLLYLSEGIACEIVPIYFKLNFLKLHGFAPELNQCGQCKQELQEESVFFEEPYHYFLCQDCCKDKESKLNPQNAKLLKLCLSQELEFISQIKEIDQLALEKLEKKTKDMLEFHFETEIECSAK